MLKQVLEESGRKAKLKCFNCELCERVVIAKKTVKRHARRQDPFYQRDDV